MQGDRLKGEFYRAPMTKLASRSNVITQINELIEYYNNLYSLIDNTFDRISTEREKMINILNQIINKTRHFKYILENFKPEIDQHVEEKISSLMGTLSTQLNEVVIEYSKNLFNHRDQTDSKIMDDALHNYELDEWKRSIEHLPTNLGIRWFGGKFSDKFFINQFNSVLHLVKVNTTDKFNNEDIINSNIIFEIFIFTKRGMSWLVLGQDGNYGYNLVTKYQSKTNDINLKIVSKNYFTPKTYDINKFDLECIINTMMDQDDIDGKNIYINVKTNLPANSFSGREGYYISNSNSFMDEIDKHFILNSANKMIYHDNKDISYNKQEGKSIDEIHELNTEPIDTSFMINPKTKKNLSGLVSNSDQITKFYSEVSLQSDLNSTSLTIEDKNINGQTLIKMMDKVNGRVINPKSYIAINKSYLENIKLQSRPYDEKTSVPVYSSGEQIEDFMDYRTLGKIQPILQNENMFEIDGSIGGETVVVNGDIKYGDSKNDVTLSNKLYNNSSFDSISSKENNLHVLEKHYDDTIDNTINEIKDTSIGVLAATNMGIYNFTKNKGIVNGTAEIGFQCIFQASDGTIYAGTNNDNGIYYYNREKEIFELTNIRKNSFSTFVEDDLGYIFAISNNGGVDNEPEYDIDSASFKTLNTIYRGKSPFTFYAFEDMLTKGIYDKNNKPVINVDSFNSNCYHWSEYSHAKNFIMTSRKNRKAFFNYNENKWYVFNPASNTLFISEDEYFYKFNRHPLHETYDNVYDVAYVDDTLYISVGTNKGETYVINYLNGVEKRIKITDTEIRNNRTMTKQNIMFGSYEDLNIKKE